MLPIPLQRLAFIRIRSLLNREVVGNSLLVRNSRDTCRTPINFIMPYYSKYFGNVWVLIPVNSYMNKRSRINRQTTCVTPM